MMAFIRTLTFLLFIPVFITLNAAEHGIIVSATSPWTDPSGYTPILLTIQSPEDTTIHLQADCHNTSASVTLAVRSGDVVHYTLLLPPAASNYFYLQSVKWKAQNDASGEERISSGKSSSEARGYVVDPMETFDLVGLNKYLKGKSSSSASSSESFSRINVDALPDRWQGYPNWLTLVLTEQGQAALNDSQINALTTWASTGGTLAVASTNQTNFWLKRSISTPVIGAGKNSEKLLAELYQLHERHENWGSLVVPVAGTETVPVKTFVVLAIAFALIVGPFNMWWVRRRKARHLFLITTPALSFITCLALIIAGLLADGIDTKRSAVQLVLLNQSTQHNVRWTGCSYFASFATSQVQLDAQSKILVFDGARRHSYRYNDTQNALDLVWQNGQLVSGSLIPARVHRQLGFVEALPERRRIEIRRTQDGWRVSNGLGVGITSLRWTDTQGQSWTCTGVTAGEQQELKLLPPTTTTNDQQIVSTDAVVKELTGRLSPEVWLAVDQLKQQPHYFLAAVEQPLDPLPGPSAVDSERPIVYIAGLAAPTGGTP